MCWQKSADYATKIESILSKDLIFSNQPRKKTWPDGQKRMTFPDSAVQKYPKDFVEV